MIVLNIACNDTLNKLADIHKNNDKILYEYIYKLKFSQN